VWEAHFTTVDDAIANGFNEHEDIMVLRVENYPLDSGFQSLESIHLECWWVYYVAFVRKMEKFIDFQSSSL
jgi:hypothetical protein